MLKQQWRKAWSQNASLFLLLAVLVSQVVFVLTGMNPSAGAVAEAYNQYAGPMDGAWSHRVTEDLERYWPDGFDPVSEEVWEAEGVKQYIPEIAVYRDFSGMIRSHISDLKAALSSDPGYDLSRVDAAYQELLSQADAGMTEFGFSPGCEGMTMQFMANWGMVLFTLFFTGNQIASDRSTGMEPVLSTARNGRSRLFRIRFGVHQLSALMVWFLIQLTLALTLTLYSGWGHISSLVQDFFFNTSPYPWNAWKTMAVVLLGSLIASQVIAAAAFCLIRLGRNLMSGLMIGSGVLILPMLLSLSHKSTAIALTLPCLMNNSWMWNAYREFRMGALYLAPWQIGLGELILISFFILLWFRKQEEKHVSI